MNFHQIESDLEVSGLVAAIRRKPALFKEITDRQAYQGSAHQNTESIFLRWCHGKTVQDAFSEIPAFDWPAMAALPEAHDLINITLRRVGAKELGRVLIVSLKPESSIEPHADEGAYADHYERFHIPLESYPGVIFKCGDEAVQMRTGELWWFNHKIQHSVENHTKVARTHLIIDCVAPRFRVERMARAV